MKGYLRDYADKLENIGDQPELSRILSTLITSFSRSATKVVAASDSLESSKQAADYICDGVDDQVQIQEAIDAIETFGCGTLLCLGKTVNLGSTGIRIKKSNVQLIAPSANITYSGTGNAIHIEPDAAVSGISEIEVHIRQITAIGSALASNTATGIYCAKLMFSSINTRIKNFKEGFGVKLDSNDATSPKKFTTTIRFPYLNCDDCKIGVEFAGDYQVASCHFHNFAWSAPSNDSYALKSTNSYSVGDFDMQFDNCYFTQGAYTGCYGLKFSGLRGHVETMFVDGSASFTSIKTSYPIIIGKINKGTIDAPHGTIHLYRLRLQHSDIFMDALAASANHVHAAITGTGAEQEITTAITNPDIPRNISITNSANSTGDVKIDGVDAKGNSVSDTITIITGGIAYGVVAFATVSKITIPAGVANPDTITVGISDKLGLSNVIYVSGDVYKVKVNNADDPTIGTVNTTYDTVDCATINAADDITIWYNSNLNIIS